MSCRHCRSRVVWNGKSPRWRATTESTGKIVSRLLTSGCIIEAEYNHHEPERRALCTRKTNIDHAGRLLIPNVTRLRSVRRVWFARQLLRQLFLIRCSISLNRGATLSAIVLSKSRHRHLDLSFGDHDSHIAVPLRVTSFSGGVTKKPATFQVISSAEFTASVYQCVPASQQGDLLTARHLKPVGCTPSRRTSPS